MTVSNVSGPGYRSPERIVPPTMTRLSALARLLLLLGIVAFIAAPMLALPDPQLEIDDYRYVSLVQDVERDFWGNIREAIVVRNSLDHLWWVSEPFTVQYVRPIVFFSYWWDVATSANLARGLLVTNVFIYLCLALAVWWLYRGVFGGGWSTALGALLFAAMVCHSECVYYVAGRTDSLAVLWMVLATCLHTLSRFRWAAPVCFFLALCTKELTLITPAFCLLVAWAKDPKASLRALIQRDLRLYLSYGAALALFLILRSVVLWGSPFTLHLAAPYAPVETFSSWWVHLYVQARAFVESVFWGVIPQNYQTAEQFKLGAGWWLSGLLLLGIGIWAVRGERATKALLFMAVLSYLPLTIVYFSERYFLVPSIALCGIVILLLHKGERSALVTLGARILLTIWIAHQGLMLGAKNLLMTHPAPPYRKEPYVLQAMFTPVREELRGARRLLFVSVPGHWVMHLFLEQYVRVFFRDPEMKVLLLSLWPQGGEAASHVQVERTEPGVVRIFGPERVMGVSDALAPTVPFSPGEIENQRTGVKVRIAEGTADAVRALEITLPPEFAHAPIVQFLPGRDAAGSQLSRLDEQLYYGRVEIHPPPSESAVPAS